MSFWKKIFGSDSVGGTGADDARLTPEQLEELSAKPIARNRMDLLWLDPQTFELLAITGGANILTDDGAGGAHPLQCTPEDIKWAKEVAAYAEEAHKAGQRGDHTAAIRHYREALKLAPGCDNYLMSIGCCYGNMGNKKIGLKYLERAAEISPGNERIRKNLAGLRRII